MHRGDTNLVVLIVLSVVVLGQPLANVLAQDKPTSGSAQSTSGSAQSASGSAQSSLRTKDTAKQTNYQDSITMRDKDRDEQIDQLESSLLKMFGLSKRPRPKGKIQIPQHMIELYKLQAGISGDIDIETNRRRIKRHPGNTIRSFYSEDSSSEHLAAEPKQQLEHHKVRLFFNVTHIPDHEALKGAELRLFRRRANDSFYNLKSNQEYLESHPSIRKPHRIDIYEIIRPSTPTSEAITRLVDTRFIKDLTKSKWESFDIHPAVNKWRNKPHTNYGLEVHFTDHKYNKPELKHVRLRRSTDSADTDWLDEQPLLIAYSDDGKGEFSRTKRNVEDIEEDEDENVHEEEEINVDDMTPEERKAYRREERRKKKQEARGRRNRKKNQCKRQPLYVDFKDVGWADWIIAPPGYDAYFCHGECPFYLPDHLNATNHAIVQTLVHSVNPQAAPSPCCVPTELSDIAMLYLDEFEKVVLKNYQDMVVLACGCR